MTTLSVAPMLALLALQLADYATTRRILALGGFERNPLVTALIREFGEAWGLAAAKLIVAILAITGALLLGPYASPALLILAGIYALVLANNLIVIARLK